MTWDNTSRRRAQLPKNWEALRRHVRQRAAGLCEWPGCEAPGTDCDHIGDNSDHNPRNLRWLCGRHHQQHTQQQAAEAAARQRAKLRHPNSR